MNDQDKIRVLWLVKGLGQGGMERLLVTHAKFGDRERFDYRAAYLVDRPHSVMDELQGLDLPVTRLGNGSGSDPRWLLELVRLVRRERIDVVHAHSPMPASMARPTLRVLTPRVKVIYTEHNNWGRYSKPTRWVNMITFPLNHNAFAVSDDCRESVTPRLRKRIETLIHGVDVEAVAAHKEDRADARAELGVGDNTVLVGTVANLRKQKNYPMLLAVAAKVTADRDDVEFVAVGQGPLEEELKALHGRLGLGDRFRFLGFREDVHRVMSAFDVLCFSSDHEGLPVALMEGKALGLPVVATAVGGIPSAVRDSVDGLLVPRADRDSLAGALTRAIDESGLLRDLSQESQIASGRFRATTFVRTIENVYAGPGLVSSRS